MRVQRLSAVRIAVSTGTVELKWLIGVQWRLRQEAGRRTTVPLRGVAGGQRVRPVA